MRVGERPSAARCSSLCSRVRLPAEQRRVQLCLVRLRQVVAYRGIDGWSSAPFARSPASPRARAQRQVASVSSLRCRRRQVQTRTHAASRSCACSSPQALPQRTPISWRTRSMCAPAFPKGSSWRRHADFEDEEGEEAVRRLRENEARSDETCGDAGETRRGEKEAQCGESLGAWRSLPVVAPGDCQCPRGPRTSTNRRRTETQQTRLPSTRLRHSSRSAASCCRLWRLCAVNSGAQRHLLDENASTCHASAVSHAGVLTRGRSTRRATRNGDLDRGRARSARC